MKPRGHVVNIYEYVENHLLNTLVFNEMSDEWLDFVVSCRRGIKHDYDCVEGPMADDTIWNYVDDFALGDIEKLSGNLLSSSVRLIKLYFVQRMR